MVIAIYLLLLPLPLLAHFAHARSVESPSASQVCNDFAAFIDWKKDSTECCGGYYEGANELLVGENVAVSFDKHTATVTSGSYRVALPGVTVENQPSGKKRLHGLNAHGTGSKLEQLGTKHYQIHDGTYSTCAPVDNHQLPWQLQASLLDINQNTGRGYAKHAIFRIHDMPVFYWPYLNFFTDKHRESGLLFPHIQYSANSGFNWLQPYYLNWAPNIDSTANVQWINRRGLQTALWGNYLTEKQSGTWGFALLPRDKLFQTFLNTPHTGYPAHAGYAALNTASTFRKAWFWRNAGKKDNWSWNWDYNHVSDDYYLADLDNKTFLPTHNINNSQLPQQASLNYDTEHWHLKNNLLHYQQLHPINQIPVTMIYNRLPDITLQGDYPHQLGDLHYQLQTQFTAFDLNERQTDGTPYINGNRIHLQPAISREFKENNYFFTPTLQALITQYQLKNQRADRASNITRTLPIVTIDSGKTWDLNNNSSYRQTLEPRIFFAYVPYRSQYEIPILDNSANNYSYDQLYQFNRFTGLDRIGDTQHVTLGITTRHFAETTSPETWHVGVSQLFYRGTPRVQNCLIPGCENDPPPSAENPNTVKRGNIGLEAVYHPNDIWTVQTHYVFNPQQHRSNSRDFSVHYQTDDSHILHLKYNFLQDANIATTPNSPNTKIIGAGLSWPIYSRWPRLQYLMGWENNVSQHYVQDTFAGIEYNTCCFAVRMVAAKIFQQFNETGRPHYDHRIYLQWELKGLGAYHSGDASGLLVQRIPGYKIQH